MQKQRFTAALLSTLLIIAVAGTLFVNFVAANFVPPPHAPPLKITVQLPENKVYTENSIPVAFTIQRSYQVTTETFRGSFYMEGEPRMCTYFLDGKETTFWPSRVSADSDSYSYKATLSGLSEGSHILGILVEYDYVFTLPYGTDISPTSGSSGAVFTVNAAAPRVSVLSLKPSKTYNVTTLPLDFSVSEPTAWLGYSLDGETAIAITGNTTLTHLSEGTHTIVVQAEDTAGSTGSSAPVAFKVETQPQETPPELQPSNPEPSETLLPSELFPATWVIAAVVIAAVALVGAGLLVYFKKRRG